MLILSNDLWPRKNHTIYEDDCLTAILDIQPIRLGHVLAIPKAHVTRLPDLTPEIAGALGAITARAAHEIYSSTVDYFITLLS